MQRLTAHQLELYWAKVDRSGGLDACWLWTGSKIGRYGAFCGQRAHRLAYLIDCNELPSDMLVCHSCDNPPCVNPRHLFLGDTVANMKDASLKGRLARKLDWEKASEIKSARGKTIRQLAVAYDVSTTTIWAIRNDKVWRA